MRYTTLSILLCFLFLGTTVLKAQYVYGTENKDAIKTCFKGFCDTDTIKLSSLKKTKSLLLISDDKDLRIAEFTILLTDINNEVYVAVIKSEALDRNNIELLSRSYKTLQLTDVFAKAKDGRLVKLKPKLYYIQP